LDTNNIITLSLLVGLLFIAISFVFYRRKRLLMLRALFSVRYLQQLFREGKLANERIYLYSMLLCLLGFPSLVLVFIQFYAPEWLVTYSPLQIYGMACGGAMAVFLLSRLFLWYFTSIFNYQEQRYLYTTMKALYQFYNALFLILIIPMVWYVRTPELIFYVYIPFFLVIFLAFFISFLRSINGVSRIHFFIYFCSLEILPYLLLIKLLIINL